MVIINFRGNQMEAEELTNSWKIRKVMGKLKVSYEVSKKDCPTKEDLEKYLEEVKML